MLIFPAQVSHRTKKDSSQATKQEKETDWPLHQICKISVSNLQAWLCIFSVSNHFVRPIVTNTITLQTLMVLF